MDKRVWIAAIGIGISWTAQAGLLDGLREIRGAVSEVTGTAREASQMGKEMQGMSGGGGVAAGAVLVSKTGSARIYKEPSKSSRSLGQAGQMVYTGSDANGFYSVSTDHGDGWVQKLVVAPR